MLSKVVADRLRERLAAMVAPVTLAAPRQDAALRELAGALAALNPELLGVELHAEGDLALLDGWGRPAGICFRGLPQGLELEALVEALVALSRGSAPLSPLGRAQAAELPPGTELWVLTTPSCPRCAQALRLAAGAAQASRGALSAVGVDVAVRPELVTEFGAATVPYFVVNGRAGFPGPVPELLLLQRLSDLSRPGAERP